MYVTTILARKKKGNAVMLENFRVCVCTNTTCSDNDNLDFLISNKKKSGKYSIRDYNYNGGRGGVMGSKEKINKYDQHSLCAYVLPHACIGI